MFLVSHRPAADPPFDEKFVSLKRSAMGRLIKLLSVSMPRAGHHATEMVLKRLFHDQFVYCEYYTAPNCCKKIPCTKGAEYEAAGALVFMQKTHDHDLTDPVPTSLEGILVQVREPVARALSNYELDLETVGPPHSPAYQQFWLGHEAAYSDAFFTKWCSLKDGRALVARYEELVLDPVAYFESIFSSFSLPKAYFDSATIMHTQGRSSAGKFKFKPRDPLQSKYYDAAHFRQFAALAAPSAAIVGYEDCDSNLPVPTGSAINLSFVAFAAFQSGNYLRALDAFTAYLALPDAHYCGLFWRAAVLRRLGRDAEAESDLRKALEIDDSFEGAYMALAEMECSRNALLPAQETLKLCLARSKNPVRTFHQIERRFSRRPELIPEHPMLTTEEVIAAFRYILGRAPESESVISAHQKAGSIAALRAVLVGSEEFASVYARLTRKK